MHAGARGLDFVTRFAVVVLALLLVWLGRPAGAQDCKDLPPGPAKKQCVMQKNPEGFQKKKDHCMALAEERGSVGKASGEKNFMQNCMQGKVGQ